VPHSAAGTDAATRDGVIAQRARWGYARDIRCRFIEEDAVSMRLNPYVAFDSDARQT